MDLITDAGTSVRQRGAVKTLRAIETYEKQKIVANYACYCLTRMLTSKITKETVENVFQFDHDQP